jgi:hypothetical protein
MAKKRLITESCVRDLKAGAELLIGPEDLATPSALDLAFERRIRVRWGAEAPRATPASPDPLWSKILASDGTYVVEVKAGRASVTRLGEGGPLAVRAESGGG